MSSKKKVPCPCGACGGKLVTSYVRHQHMKAFVAEKSGDDSNKAKSTSRPSNEVSDSNSTATCSSSLNQLQGRSASGSQVM